ncbi:MAG TPA: phosphatidylcholine/phosphatidylserine synthase [Terriglobales bacterium]
MKVALPMRHHEDELLAPKRRMRKGMYILPSLFTAANIGAGYFAITETLQGTVADSWHFDLAAKAIGIAIVADGLDGFIARLTNTTSAFGREFDSLADVITFGVAPALLAWMWGFRWLPDFSHPELRMRMIHLGVMATFLFLVAGASRLARFNIQVNPQPSNPGRPGKKYFVGMPIPAGAAVIASTVHLLEGNPIESWWLATFWFGLILSAGFLMVSTWRFYSFKDLNLRNRHPFQLVILIGGFLWLLIIFSGPLLFVLSTTYMLSGVMTRLASLFRRRPPKAAAGAAYQEAPEPR